MTRRRFIACLLFASAAAACLPRPARVAGRPPPARKPAGVPRVPLLLLNRPPEACGPLALDLSGWDPGRGGASYTGRTRRRGLCGWRTGLIRRTNDQS